MVRVASFASLMFMPILIGCNGDSSNVDPPIEVSITSSTVSIDENALEPVTVTVSLAESSNKNISVTLSVSGTATQLVDYEISSTSVQFPVGVTSTSISITPIRDWEFDPNEFIELSIGSIQGNAIANANTSRVSIYLSDGEVPADYKANISGDLVIFNRTTIYSSSIVYRFTVYNLGRKTTSSTTARFEIREALRDSSTTVYSRTLNIPSLSAWGSFTTSVSVVLFTSRYAPDTTYYGFASIDPAPEEISARSQFGTTYFGFTLDENLDIVQSCTLTEPEETSDTTDPLLDHHWNMENTGQNAFAQNGGVLGADLRMDTVMSEGPYGEEVTIAVVDTGLEVCHPDLTENVDVNGSYNFAGRGVYSRQWYGADELDPFNPTSLGDHGTSVAGIISAVADNGIGGRGVAPHSRLRGFNYLGTNSDTEEALGFSDDKPRSSDVDIFNLSYGRLGRQSNVSSWSYNLHERGISDLREGLGALYVKSAGNDFFDCVSLEHDIRSEIGCSSAHGDPLNNLPFLLVVGAFNASDTRAGYSSTGSNLWVSAPAGEYGAEFPASISTDQQGRRRGLVVLANRGLALRESENPRGNYISTMNGTSAAAPNTSGAIAVLLSLKPELTWRDVKYILAKTARKIDPNILPVRIAFGGGTPYTLQHGWIENSAGYNFHNWYGFGAIDLDEAVDFARSYSPDTLGTLNVSDNFRNGDTLNVPDYDSSGIESRISVTGFSDSASIEAVVLNIEGAHNFLPDLGITLTSPDGTVSVMNQVFNDFLVHNTSLSWNLLSNAFFGENPNGEWTLQLVDAARNDRGEITEWSLQFYYGTHP